MAIREDFFLTFCEDLEMATREDFPFPGHGQLSFVSRDNERTAPWGAAPFSSPTRSSRGYPVDHRS